MYRKWMLAAAAVAQLSACTVFVPRATEPTDGPRARIRVIAGGGDLIVTPKRQPGGRHGEFVAHGVLYPGSRQKLGMPDHEEPARWADEYYVEADQDVQVWFTYDVRTPGSKYAPGTRQSCGPVDGQFHVDEGADYEVSARVDAGMRGCFVDVKRIIELSGKAYFLPVRVGPRVLPK